MIKKRRNWRIDLLQTELFWIDMVHKNELKTLEKILKYFETPNTSFIKGYNTEYETNIKDIYI